MAAMRSPARNLLPSASVYSHQARTMRETPEQYTKRMLALVGTNDPWTVLASTPSLLHTLVADRPRAQLERKPDPGRWSVIEILAHLADAEIVGAWRIRAILA